jgi:hypothetical protein
VTTIEYDKECKNCGQTIHMSNTSGKFGAYNQDGTFHRCMDSQSQPQQQQQTTQQKPVVQQVKEYVRDKAVAQSGPLSMLKIIASVSVEEIEQSYQAFMLRVLGQGGKVQGCQFQATNDLLAVAIYYEIPNRVNGVDA